MDSGTPSTVIPTPLAPPVALAPFRAQMLASQRIGDPQSARAFARPYRDVARRLARWESQGHVETLPHDALYLHEYTVGGLTARGLVGLIDLTRLAAPGQTPAVFPHEDVHPDQVRELADRMEEMAMNPAPILLVHEGPAALRALIHQIVVGEPDRAFTDRSGNQHRLWAITTPVTIRRVQELMAPAHVMIADGHHRYAGYLALARRHPGTGYDRGLAMIVDQRDTPLFLGAIHRVLPGRTLDEFGGWATDHGATIRLLDDQEAALQHLDPQTVVAGDGPRWLVVSLPTPAPVSPVEWLDQVLTDAEVSEVEFHHSVESALGRPDSLTVLLPTPALERIAEVAAAGNVLPEKATSFQPKPPLGVLMRHVDA